MVGEEKYRSHRTFCKRERKKKNGEIRERDKAAEE